MAKILVTGSSGFLGSETVNYFKKLGHDVVGVDMFPGKQTIHVMDARTFVQTNTDNYDVVFHFAAIVGGRANIESNYLQMMENVEIDRTVFEWAVKHSAHLIYPSSSAVYPIDYQDSVNTSTALVESMIDFSTNTIGVSDHLYGWSKLCAERMLWEMSKSTDINISIFRPFSGYGPTQSLNYPFPNLVNNVKKNPRRVEVWGTGEQQRDFIHINDILQSFDKCLSQNKKYTVVNLGSGVGTSFNDLIRLISKTLYDINDVEIIRLVDRPVGVQSRTANIEKQLALGMSAKISLIEGIRTFEK